MRRKRTLKRFVDSLVRPASDEVQRVEEPDPAWTSWAASHGFEYDHDGGAFEGGRYFEAMPDRHGMGEQCYGVVRGSWNGFPFTFFSRKSWNAIGSRSRPATTAGGLIVDLPRRLRADIVAMSPKDAFAAAGGSLPSSGSFEWKSADVLFGRGRWRHPADIEGILQSITLQFQAAPAELWEP